MLLAASYVLNIILLALVRANCGQLINNIVSESNQCAADKDEDFTYRGDKGPLHWWMTYPKCNGTSQSPIDINITQMDANLSPLKIENYTIFVKKNKAIMENKGYTVQVTPEDGVNRTILVDNVTYYLQQLHFHWGSKKENGSEHTINGTSYAMEIHFVHASDRGKLAVVGVLCLENVLGNSTELKKIAVELKMTMYKNTKTQLPFDLNLSDFLPKNASHYYRYNGSLTTPPCSEGVTWLVAMNPIVVGNKEMSLFRNLLYSTTKDKATERCKLIDNFRPTQSLNDRLVWRLLTDDNEVKTK